MRQVGGENLLKQFEPGACEQPIESWAEKLEGTLAFLNGDGFRRFRRGLKFEPESE